MPFMTIEHHGAKDGVTGSCHQLKINENTSVQVDCGLFQGKEAPSGVDAQHLGFSLEGVRALIVTHVHIDHVGRIPGLLAAGFKGPIICSQPSAHLLPPVSEDAFKLGISRDSKYVEPYLQRVSEQVVALPYNQWFSLIDQNGCTLAVRLQRAGHILGSAYVELDLTNNGKNSRIVFSGDLGSRNTPLLPAPESPERADVLVLESTYGDRIHEDRATRIERLQAAIDRALENKGTVLIPAFSIGRTQELLYELEELLEKEILRGAGAFEDEGTQLPVILDSPLASRFTNVYREMRPFWDEEAQGRLAQGRNPLAFEQLLTIDSHEDHLKMVRYLAESGRPAIVIAGSGMCNAGRIVSYLKAMLSDPRHDVLFVGYQAEGTPGRDIQRYGPEGGYVWLDDEKIDIRARVETISGYSAHADQKDLVEFVEGISGERPQVRLVHGSLNAKHILSERLNLSK
ncbi:MBL fold metallo-hydrolase RNA specificity domain-containing protein [Idiomarina abyssalis]|uniref:MBL fold metallo-hydrolase RNA specificity domain-containing protein n=1 Tax=Idiomarina abyssalis TaxID=86102 RepID=UPI003A942E64